MSDEKEDKLLSWIDIYPDHCVAGFVAHGTKRAPATRKFDDEEQARQWILEEAAAIDARVEWNEPDGC